MNSCPTARDHQRTVQHGGWVVLVPFGDVALLGDQAPVGQLEGVQVRQVPAGEGLVDRGREVREGVLGADSQFPARWWPQLSAVAAVEEFDADGQPVGPVCGG